MFRIVKNDCLKELKRLRSNSVDSLITDPPAGLKIFGHEWDSDKGGRSQWVAWMTEVMSECHRVLKPGAHGIVWAIPKKSHWTALALEDAGFRIRDVISHVFSSGFPKSQDLEKSYLSARHLDALKVQEISRWLKSKKEDLKLTNSDLDRLCGIRGGSCHWTNSENLKQLSLPTSKQWQKIKSLLGSIPKHIDDYFENNNQANFNQRLQESKKWRGWGTELKPAHEHWILVQKEPSTFNLASNLNLHNVGGINIDASRVFTREKIKEAKSPKMSGNGIWDKSSDRNYTYRPHAGGRFPSNFVLTKDHGLRLGKDHYLSPTRQSKFFKKFKYEPALYVSKPSSDEKGTNNSHPTVKPQKLMQYFCKMLTPRNGLILDPFLGSGSTGVAAVDLGFQFYGIEKQKEYFEIAKTRLLKAAHQKIGGE